jgi:HPt (histidine-containing phosphotransfer) domain-containing protein
MNENAGDSAPYQVLNLAGAIEFLGDQQAVSELLQPLVISLSKDIGEVERLLGQRDMPGVARTLHSLKGFIPVFCHAQVAAQLVDIEKRSRSDDSPQMRAQVQALMQPLRQLVQESNSFLQQAGG